MSARPRKILFSFCDAELSVLVETALKCDKICLVSWAYEYSLKYVDLFEEYCDDDLVRQAREAAHLWAKGIIKMPEAKRYILAAHKAASECGNRVAEAAARAVAQAASTVHCARHWGGLALYGLTALAEKYGRDSAEVKEEIARLVKGLERIAADKSYKEESWVGFLLK